MLLRRKMQEHLEGWKNDLPEAWRGVFQNPEFDINLNAALGDVDIPDEIQVFPGRRDRAINDAPEGAHICRAFDGIEPNGVRVVILGKDPYPAIESATGRAFEDGSADNLERALRPALCALALSVLELHPEAMRPTFCHGRAGRAATIRATFDRLTQAGVLFVNRTWTFSRKKNARQNIRDQDFHEGLWNPVAERLLRYLIEDRDAPLVILLLGSKARDFFDQLNLPSRENVVVEDQAHPSDPQLRYFARTNPLFRVNRALENAGTDPILWWE